MEVIDFITYAVYIAPLRSPPGAGFPVQFRFYPREALRAMPRIDQHNFMQSHDYKKIYDDDDVTIKTSLSAGCRLLGGSVSGSGRRSRS